jgi:hypothetical protein
MIAPPLLFQFLMPIGLDPQNGTPGWIVEWLIRSSAGKEKAKESRQTHGAKEFFSSWTAVSFPEPERLHSSELRVW